MTEYSRKFGSNFPTKVMELHNYSDVTKDTYPIVQQIMVAYMAGEEETATLLLAKYPELKKCLITADTWNLFDEERYNTQIYAKQQGQIIDTGKEKPTNPIGEYVWIGGTV